MEMDNVFFWLQPCRGKSMGFFIVENTLELICANTSQSGTFLRAMRLAYCKIVVLHPDATAEAGVRAELKRIGVVNLVDFKVVSTTRETSLTRTSIVWFERRRE